MPAPEACSGGARSTWARSGPDLGRQGHGHLCCLSELGVPARGSCSRACGGRAWFSPGRWPCVCGCVPVLLLWLFGWTKGMPMLLVCAAREGLAAPVTGHRGGVGNQLDGGCLNPTI
jgi:hypothetical protein